MSSDINLNPANEPRYPISPTNLDTEGHGFPRYVEDAADSAADADTEGHARARFIEDAAAAIEGEEDTEGHRRPPGV